MTVDEWIEGYRTAWEERDPEAASSLFSESSSYRANIFEEPFTGREGVAAYWASVTGSQSSVRVRMGTPFGEGPRVAVEFWTNMDVGGEPVTLPGCLLLDFDNDGLCRRLREYWHYVEGRFDPPPEWGQ